MDIEKSTSTQFDVMNIKEYEKTIDLFGQELSKALILHDAIAELIVQSNENFEVFEQYHEFFNDLVYMTFYNELLHSICRLQDETRDCMSIIKLLKKNEDLKDNKSNEEADVLKALEQSPTSKKIRTIRDKLGRAHLDKKCSIDIIKQSKLYEENKVGLSEIYEHILLLVKAVEILSRRLDHPIILLRPTTKIRGEIRNLFSNLKTKNEV